MRINFPALLIVLGSGLCTHAIYPLRVLGQERVESGFTVSVGSPAVNSFRALPSSILGINGFFGGRPTLNSPLLLGSELGFATYGRDGDMETLTGSPESGSSSIDSYDNIASGHLFLRLQPATGIVRPYVEGLAGLRVYITSKRIVGPATDRVLIPPVAVRMKQAVFSYGIGAGLSLRLVTEGTYQSPGNIAVAIGIRRLFGSPSNYPLPPLENIHRDHRSAFLALSRSSILESRIGLEFQF